MNPSPLRAELASLLQMPLDQRASALLLAWATAILASSEAIPPIPKLAEEFSQRLSERLRLKKEYRLDNESDARERLKQWGRWYALVREVLVADGVCALRQLADAGWTRRVDAVSERLGRQVKALRALNLPWWPDEVVEENPWRRLSLLDWAEREIGRLETRMIRQRGARGGTDDRGEWAPAEGLL